MRIGVILTSAMNALAGLVLAGVWAVVHAAVGLPPVVLAIALALLAQGAFTLYYVARVAGRAAPLLTLLLLGGELAALLAGGAAVLGGMGHIVLTLARDPEFGPMTLGALMSVQAGVTLLWAGRSLPAPHAAA